MPQSQGKGNQITYPALSGQQQYGQPMQQPSQGKASSGQPQYAQTMQYAADSMDQSQTHNAMNQQNAVMPMGTPTEKPPVGAPMPQSNTNAPALLSSFAQPMLQDQQGNAGQQTADMQNTDFGGNNSYPNTIGQGNNQSQQPHGFMGKGKGA